MTARTRRRRFSRFLGAALLAMIAIPLAAAEDAGPFESDGPQQEKIEMRLWRDNFLSRSVGTDDDRIHAYAGELLILDDNVYLRDRDEEHDAVQVRFAGLDMRLEREETYRLGLAAETRYYDYHRLSDENHSEYDLKPSFEYIFNDMLKLKMSGRLAKSVSPIDLTTVDRIESHSANGDFQVSITPTDLWGVDLKWRIKDKEYDVSQYRRLDHQENAWTLAPFYMVTDKLKVGVELTWGDVDYDKDIHNNADYWEMRLAGTYAPDDKWLFYLSLGYQDRDYDHQGPTYALVGEEVPVLTLIDSGSNPDRTEFDGLVFTGSALYKYSEKWTFGLSAARMPLESSAGNFYAFNRFSIHAAYLPIDPLKLSAELFNEYVDESNTKDSDRFGLSTAVTWSFSEWAGVGASYQYKRKYSDDPNGEYVNNVATLGVWFTF
ncbi:MAG: hypothetical protein V1918_09430 [Planctomycetota bacterium]